MAPTLAIADLRRTKMKAEATEEESLRRRNEELEREVREAREREERLRSELLQTAARLRAAEEAEERLCSQLGELEAEAAAHARAYHLRIVSLSDRLAQALRPLDSNRDRAI